MTSKVLNKTRKPHATQKSKNHSSFRGRQNNTSNCNNLDVKEIQRLYDTYADIDENSEPSDKKFVCRIMKSSCSDLLSQYCDCCPKNTCIRARDYEMNADTDCNSWVNKINCPNEKPINPATSRAAYFNAFDSDTSIMHENYKNYGKRKIRKLHKKKTKPRRKARRKLITRIQKMLKKRKIIRRKKFNNRNCYF